VAAALLAACGGDGEDDATATPKRTSTPRRPTATRTATVTPTAPSTATPTPTPPPAAPQPTQPPAQGPPPAQPGRPPAAPGVSVPPGFLAFVAGGGYNQPTSIAVAPDGSLYLSERYGTIRRLVDFNGDGIYDQQSPVVSVSGVVTGIAFSPNGQLYISRTGRVSVLSGGGVRDIISGLPNGRHQNNGLAFAGGKLYITNGSTCDDCVEGDPRSATILQANLDGSGLRVYARGLRNPYDLAFDGSGRLWATDNGSDAPCATNDELNQIVDGGDYGWPYGAACNEFADGIAPAADLGAHTASTGITAYTGGQFPSNYRGLFLTLWGSTAFSPQVAPGLKHVSGGRATSFGSGFANPIDVIMDRDGSLLVVAFGSGTVYRIVYVG
jgi:glucose/arabinose dehydrogenase